MRAIEYVDAFDHLARILLEEEDEELVGTALDDVGQPFSLLSVQLSWKNHVGYGIHHLLLVGLTCEGILPVLGLQSSLLVITAFSLPFRKEYTRTLATTFASALGHALGGSERA